ncbi:hypothetical protein [Rhizobium arsenicireducens]
MRIFILIAVFSLVTSQLTGAAANAAEFRPEKTVRHGVWEATLYRNLGSNQLFCAAETRDGNTDFRINRYKVSGESFLEIYSQEWSLMPGNVGFKIDFNVRGQAYTAELRGRSWGDSYTHDFTDVKNYEALLGLIAQSSSFDVKNSNDVTIAQFSGIGAKDAILAYLECVED